jgi:hypothetical protein
MVLSKQGPYTDQDYQETYDKYHAEVLQKNLAEAQQFNSKYLTDGKLNSTFRTVVDDTLAKTLEKRKQVIRYERGVACFSSKKDDILMWAHYADGHSGFCLEFDPSFYPFEKALEVKYRSSIPKMNMINVLLDKPDFETEFEDSITVKYKDWKYEAEWRIPHKEANKFHGYDPKALTSIYFGPRMDISHIEIIYLILRGQNRNVKLYKGILNGKSFSIEFGEFKLTL